MKTKFKLLSGLLFTIFMILLCLNSKGEVPFTVVQLQNLCRMKQAGFIAAMKAYPNYKEDKTKRTENKCLFKYNNNGKLSWISGTKNENTGLTNIEVGGHMSTDNLNSFTSNLKNYYGYKDSTKADDKIKGIQYFNHVSFDVHIYNINTNTIINIWTILSEFTPHKPVLYHIDALNLKNQAFILFGAGAGGEKNIVCHDKLVLDEDNYKITGIVNGKPIEFEITELESEAGGKQTKGNSNDKSFQIGNLGDRDSKLKPEVKQKYIIIKGNTNQISGYFKFFEDEEGFEMHFGTPHYDLGAALNALDIETFKKYIDDGMDVNAYNYYTNSIPLDGIIMVSERVYTGSPEKINKLLDIIKLFIDNGADLNITHTYIDTVLHETLLLHACCNTNFLRPKTPSSVQFYNQVVEMLLKNGADPNIGSEYGTTPLSASIECGRLEQVRILLTHGAIKNTIPTLKGIEAHSVLPRAKELVASAKNKEEEENAKAILELLEK